MYTNTHYVNYYYPVYDHSFIRQNRYNSSIDNILKAILNGISSEASAIDFYTRLAKAAATSEQRQAIEHALEDEKIHLRTFTQLYQTLTGKKPVYQTKITRFRNFQEGLRIAYEQELEAYETYRDNYLSTQDPMIRDAFFRAMTDEIEHALRFSHVLNKK